MVHISAVGFTDGATGTIEEVALRTARLRTLNGEVVIVPNGQKVGEEAFDEEALRPLLLDPPTVMGVESFEVG